MTTTAIEYALMAGRAYFSTRSAINKFPGLAGWLEPLDKRKVDDTTGFEAGYFQRGNEIVISYSGTDPNNTSILSPDMKANIALANGNWSDQLLQAAEYYLSVKKANPNATITLTGHSLGGGLAALVGVFFGVQASTFDQAPFAASAVDLSNNAGTLKNLLIGKRDISNNPVYTVADLAPLTDYLQMRGPNNKVPRGALVDTVRVDGEFVGNGIIGGLFNAIGNAATGLTHGPYSSPSIDLHSQALLTAFLQSTSSAASGSNPQQTLSEVTKRLTDLLRMVFDKNLFAHETGPNSPDENFLERLVRHEAGVTGPASADAMVTRFTQDLWKLAQDGGLTLHDSLTDVTLNNVSKALTAFAMQMYYDDTANASNANKQLFTDLSTAGTGSNGIRFDIADTSKNLSDKIVAGKSVGYGDLLSDIKGFKQYFQSYLDSTAALSNTERSLIKSMLPQLRDWYVQAGVGGMTATDGQNRGAFMLGASGADTLTGSALADLLVGNAGDDTLKGGQGNDILLGGAGTDTYIYSRGDGFDTIRDSDGRGNIVDDGLTLIGGAQYGDKRVFSGKDANGTSHVYTFVKGDSASGGDLIVDGNILIKDYKAASGNAMGLALDGARAAVDPQTSNDIFGDRAALDQDPITAGVQITVDALGNVLTDPSTPDAGRADTLYDSAGDDRVSSGGGDDTVNATRGGDDFIETGSGRDYADGGAGDDVTTASACA